jgi:hypothetical protein
MKGRKETQTICRRLRCRDVKVPPHERPDHTYTHMITHAHTITHTHVSLVFSSEWVLSSKYGPAHERVSQVGFEDPYMVINTPGHTTHTTARVPEEPSRVPTANSQCELPTPSVSNSTVEGHACRSVKRCWTSRDILKNEKSFVILRGSRMK